MDPLENAANLFKAVSDVGRLRVIQALKSGERCVGDLSAELGDDVSIVSHRLKVLYQQNLIRKRRDGQHIYYSLADEHINQLVVNAVQHVIECH